MALSRFCRLGAAIKAPFYYFLEAEADLSYWKGEFHIYSEYSVLQKMHFM
jgi:hypothetical protein